MRVMRSVVTRSRHGAVRSRCRNAHIDAETGLDAPDSLVGGVVVPLLVCAATAVPDLQARSCEAASTSDRRYARTGDGPKVGGVEAPARKSGDQRLLLEDPLLRKCRELRKEIEWHLVLMRGSLVRRVAFPQPHLGAILGAVLCDIPAHVVVGSVSGGASAKIAREGCASNRKTRGGPDGLVGAQCQNLPLLAEAPVTVVQLQRCAIGELRGG